jgi:hypothetical protein
VFKNVRNNINTLYKRKKEGKRSPQNKKIKISQQPGLTSHNQWKCPQIFELFQVEREKKKKIREKTTRTQK